MFRPLIILRKYSGYFPNSLRIGSTGDLQFPREVNFIRTTEPIRLSVHYPKTAEGLEELTGRVSDAHAAAVTQRIKALNCPTSQKLELLDAIIETVKERSKEQP